MPLVEWSIKNIDHGLKFLYSHVMLINIKGLFNKSLKGM